MCNKSELSPYAEELVSYCGDRFGFKEPPSLFFSDDEDNASNPLGKTAHYNPAEKSVTVFITGRHIKDVLRSIAHELVHHAQNLRGDLSPEKCGKMSKTYAQDNPHMRDMEKEAYLEGSMAVRDWENTRNNNIMENKTMSKEFENKVRDLIKKIVSEGYYKRDDVDNDSEEYPPHPGRCAKCGMDPCGCEHYDDEDMEPNLDSEYYEDEDANKYGYLPMKPRGKVEDDDEFDDIIDPTIDPEYEASQPMGRDRDFEAAIRRKMAKRASLKEEDIEDTKIITPEQEQSLYEARFTNRDTKLFEKLMNKWAK